MEKVWKGVIYNKKDLSYRIEVSNYGELRNTVNKKVYKLNLFNRQYLGSNISFGSRGSQKPIKVHKAVAEAFLDNFENKPMVNHIDGNKKNNRVDNLEWCTCKENNQHAYDNGLKHHYGVKKDLLTILSEDDINYIKKSYIPYDREFGARAIGKKIGVTHHIIIKAFNYMDMKK